MANEVKFEVCPLWNTTAAELLPNNKKLAEKIKAFRDFKKQNPIAAFGGSDTMFVGAGPIAKALGERARHAHLTQDICIVYSVSGKNPTVIKLYGLFRHKDIGTGDTPNIRKQQSAADRMKDQTWNDSVLEGKKRKSYARKK
jgi:hypothetical protein